VVDLYLPRKRNLPYREIPPAFPGDHPTIVMDCGTLDGHQFEELEQKVQEDAQERLKKQGGRYQGPLRVRITRYISKATGKIIRYVIEQKRED
jgi:hypothetical protein